MGTKQQLVMILMAMLIFAGTAQADRRKYAWTYQYATLAPGDAELELYQTTRLKEQNSWEYRIEIEHGITPRMDLSVYQIFVQNEGEALSWDAFQIRARYRLAEPGRYLMDPLLYVEYNRKTDLTRQNKAEFKLILSRGFDRWDLSVNPLYEFFWAPGDPVHEFGYDAGLSYEWSYSFSTGIESLYRYEVLPNEKNESALYVGPSMSYATGSLFYTVGYLWGLNDEADDGRVRLLMGIDL